MIRAFFWIMYFIGFTAGFVTQTPIPSTRIRSTRVFVATPIDGGKRQNRDAHNTPKPKITTISSAEEYLDFIAEDDRLCMVK